MIDRNTEEEFFDISESISLENDFNSEEPETKFTLLQDIYENRKIIIFTAIFLPIIVVAFILDYFAEYTLCIHNKSIEKKENAKKAKERALFLKKINQNNNSLLTKEEKKLKQRMLNKLAKKPKVPYINRDGSFNYNEYLMQRKNAKIDWSKFRDDYGYICETSKLSNEAMYRLVKSRRFNRVECIQDKNLANLIINENFSYIYNVDSDVFKNDYFFTKKILDRAIKTDNTYEFIEYFKRDYSMSSPIFANLMIEALEIKNNIIHIYDISSEIIDNFLLNEDFVRRYINHHFEILNNFAKSKSTSQTSIFYLAHEEINNKFEEAYRNFEQERLLKLLPAKQDAAPVKSRKKI